MPRDPNFVKRFAQEAKAIAALEHSHILPVHDFGTQDDINYMVMRYVTGGTLSDIMGTKVPLEKVTKYVADVARALDYAHSRGVIHRDIKPSNILIDEQGEVLLTDFGIAKMVEGSESTQLTAAGSVLGTPAYMSPEQAQSSDIDGRSDIYSLGVVLYELLTGQPPFQAETPFAIVIKHLHDPLPPPHTINPTIPDVFERVVLKAMAKAPEDRFTTAGDMALALNNALRDSQVQMQSSSTPPPTPAPPAPTTQAPNLAQTEGDISDANPPPKKSNKAMFIGGGVAALLACITIGCLALLLSRASDNANQAQATATSRVQLEDASTDTADRTAVGLPGNAQPATTDTPPDIESEPEPTDDVEPEMEEDSNEPESGDLLLFDDFSNNDNEWPVEYLEDELGFYEAFVDDEQEEYVVAVGSDTDDGHVVWFSPTMNDLTDFVFSIEADAETESESYLYGVVFRSNDQGAYFFEIDFEGFSVTAIDANDDWIELVEYTFSDAVKPDDVNELRVEAIGSQFTFFINNEEVASMEDNSFPKGTLGVVADAFERGDELTVVFDNLRVTTP